MAERVNSICDNVYIKERRLSVRKPPDSSGVVQKEAALDGLARFGLNLNHLFA